MGRQVKEELDLRHRERHALTGVDLATVHGLALTQPTDERLGELALRIPALRVIGDRSGSLDEATVGACLAAVAAGAHAVRVHDVAPVVAALAAYRSTARSFVATSSGDV